MFIKGCTRSSLSTQARLSSVALRAGTKGSTMCQWNMTISQAWLIHAFMLFTSNIVATIWILQEKTRIIRIEAFFQSFVVKFWWAYMNCNPQPVVWSSVLCMQRCSLLPSCQFKAIWPLSSDMDKARRIAARSLCWNILCINPIDDSLGKSL